MTLEELPGILPLYGAQGTILLPRAQLPLILIDSEGQAALESALTDKSRLLGVLQANPKGGHFKKGCVGRIVSFQENIRPFVLLQGLCRFNIEEIFEGPVLKARVSYEGYQKDLDDFFSDPFMDRKRLLDRLKAYLSDQEISANWEEIDHASDDLILNSLTMACPFEPIEKQALLETESLSERCDMMIALMEMSQPYFPRRGPVLH